MNSPLRHLIYLDRILHVFRVYVRVGNISVNIREFFSPLLLNIYEVVLCVKSVKMILRDYHVYTLVPIMPLFT